MEERWGVLLSHPPDSRGPLLRETAARKATGHYESLSDNHERLPAISELPSNSPPPEPVRYAFRSFDRRWILPDARLCDRPRPQLWSAHSRDQIYLTSLLTGVLGLGPAATATSFLPDLHHFRGSFGGKDVIPLYRDAAATQPNISRNLLRTLSSAFGRDISAQNFFCYAYAVLATPAYVEIFSEELTIPGPRLPICRDSALFLRVAELGRRLIWFHTYGERFAPPRRQGFRIPQGSARCHRGVPTSSEGYPENFSYDSTTEVLQVGEGIFGPVSVAIWQFKVSGLPIVESWLSYRMKAGAGRSSSPLDRLRPERWTADVTRELLELLWVLEATIAMLPELKAGFDEIISGETFGANELPRPTAEERGGVDEDEPEPEQREMNL